jgi:hypothetical protein
MRLLEYKSGSDFSLVEFLGSKIPPYAILSHTWGPDNQEVKYQDLVNGMGKEKEGYRKLTFCKEQAAKDDLEYFWIDTCCIDKSSSAELSEAINSMFRYYRDATKCYVYLADVSSTGCDGVGEEFSTSRWFTRGWTLQELIAPKCVEFFSAEGSLLGDKCSHMQEISNITNIATEALTGAALSSFSIEERMAWAKERTTTRDEDLAYCLLGIFDIQMPLIYGEGKAKARKRLQKEIKESSGDAAAIVESNTQSTNLARDETLSKIQRWLSAPNPSVNYEKALKLRQQDTGLWFF